MMNKLSKFGYQQLIFNDLEWLAIQPDGMEKQHIEIVLRDSVYQHYPNKKSQPDADIQKLIDENIELSNKLCETLAKHEKSNVFSLDTDEWISVDDDLPPPHKTVLVKCTNGDIYQARCCYDVNGSWWCAYSELLSVVFDKYGVTIAYWK